MPHGILVGLYLGDGRVGLVKAQSERADALYDPVEGLLLVTLEVKVISVDVRTTVLGDVVHGVICAERA